MGDDPSKRMYPNTFYPNTPGYYPPPPGIYPPPYPGVPPHMSGYQPPVQPTMVTTIHHAPTNPLVTITGPQPYSSMVTNLRDKALSAVHTQVSRSRLWSRIKGYSWVTVNLIGGNPGSCRHLESSAVVAGYDTDRTPIWVGRAHHGGDLIPCKVLPMHGLAYVPFSGQEISKHNIEVLCADPARVQWLPSSNGFANHSAVNGGHTSTGETLFIGRAHYNNSLTPGKIHPSHHCLYISHGGQEIPIRSYETLIIV